MNRFNLSPEDADKFLSAAKMLARNKVDTIAFANRAEGIVNGNSSRKLAAIAQLLGRPVPPSRTEASVKVLADAVAKFQEAESGNIHHFNQPDDQQLASACSVMGH